MKSETRYKITGKGKEMVAHAVQLVADGQTVDQAAEATIRKSMPDFDPDNPNHSAALLTFAALVAMKIDNAPAAEGWLK